MLVRVTAFVVWALVAATAVFWSLRLLVRPQPAPAYALVVGEGATMRGDLSRLFGAAPVAAAPNAPAAPELASRFKLLGVMAPKATAPVAAQRVGYALIAVDGKPARPFAVGATVDPGLVLQSVSLRTASIGPVEGAAAVKLEMPPLPAPTTGTLPPVGSPAAPSATPAIPAPAATPATPAPAGAVRPPLPVRPPGVPVPPATGAPAGMPRPGGPLTQ